jgi:hypothetical protein
LRLGVLLPILIAAAFQCTGCTSQRAVTPASTSSFDEIQQRIDEINADEDDSAVESDSVEDA